MPDRTVRQQPLDVGLTNRSEGAQQHRQERDESDDLLPLRQQIAERSDHHPNEQGKGGNLRGSRKECRHRRWRAFIDVGCPHMERRGGNLEGKTGDQEHQTDDNAERRPIGRDAPKTLRDSGKIRGAGKTVNQRRAIEQHARRQGPEHKILEARLGRLRAIAPDRRHHVEPQALQF